MKYPETSKRLLLAMAQSDTKAVELASKSGLSKASISHYVNGTHEPGHKAAYAMANVLHVNPLWLMGLDVKMEPDKPRVSMILSYGEEELIYAFRNASYDTQTAVCAVLGIKRELLLPKEESIVSSKEA